MASGGIPKDTVWATVQADESVQTFEHPLTEMTLTKEQFYGTFKAVLDQLDGTDMSSFVDFFFERNPVQQTHLKYVGENEKQDFLDWAIDEGCMPSVKEVSQGEDDAVRKARLAAQREEAEARKVKAAADARAQAKQAAMIEAKRSAAAANPAPKDAKQIANRVNGLAGLRRKKKPNPDKIARAEEALATAVAAFLAAYPEQMALLPLEVVPEEHKDSVAAEQAAAAAAAPPVVPKKGKKGKHKGVASPAAAASAAAAGSGAAESKEAAPAPAPAPAVAAAAAAPEAEPVTWRRRGVVGIAMDSDSDSDSDGEGGSDSDSDGSSSEEEA